MNSGADLKAFVGEHGGAVCTSGNAEKAFRWALSEGDAVFFFPDEHLGRNTACRLGMAPDEPLVWNPRKAELGGLAEDGARPGRRDPLEGLLQRAHGLHRAPDRGGPRGRPRRAGDRAPGVPAAGGGGGRRGRQHRVHHPPLRGAARPASSAVIGTDWNLVNRLRLRHPDKRISCLKEDICPCVTMNRIDLPKLTWCLESLAAGEMVNSIRVEEEMRRLGPGRARPDARPGVTAAGAGRRGARRGPGERGDITSALGRAGRSARPRRGWSRGADGVLAGRAAAEEVLPPDRHRRAVARRGRRAPGAPARSWRSSRARPARC